MNRLYFLHLAWTGLRKNRKFSLPYVITCISMIMMFYIVSFLSVSKAISAVRGGDEIQALLMFGQYVVAFFAVIFLIYSDTFLIRRRKKEFGLYNILGMGKRDIGRILFWETLIVAAGTLAAGLFLGILFSKLGELCVINLLRAPVSFNFDVSASVVLVTLIIFAADFVFIFFKNLVSVHATNPIELLHSENVGEKPPRANWLFGILGLIILAVAYYIAVSIEQPVAAALWFFVAAAMVILATYLLFICGSVMLCRLLQKDRNYYYKTQHFISVSSMMYRMKRNGAGLASICILGTMVLVMLSSTSCLYFGVEDSVNRQYPKDYNISLNLDTPEAMTLELEDELFSTIRKVAADNAVAVEGLYAGRTAGVTACLENGVFSADVNSVDALNQTTMNEVYYVQIIPLEDFNTYVGQNQTVASDELLVFGAVNGFKYDRIIMKDGTEYKVRKVDGREISGDSPETDILPYLYIVPADFTAFVTDETVRDWVYLSVTAGFDCNLPEDEQVEFMNPLLDALSDMSHNGTTPFHYRVSSQAEMRDYTYQSNAGMFFLGIMLSIVFLFATVLIVYYKQISEGYEDQARFEIMQKVGMTKKDIRRSINSQMLTVFFLPLIFAGLHLAFAFPMLVKLFILFGIVNLKLLISAAVIAFLVFAAFYCLVYRITTNAYYSIAVSAAD